MKKQTININGKAYPCYPTSGAMLRFRKETGRELSQLDAESFSDICTWLWCCILGACKREGVEFPFTGSLMDFADNIDVDDLNEWTRAMAGDADGTDNAKKKKAKV